MRRALAWIAGLAGIAALGRLAARRRRSPDARAKERAHPGEPAASDPAAELRARLSEQRERDVVPDAEPETLDERRRRIHAKAQQAIDEMREPSA